MQRYAFVLAPLFDSEDLVWIAPAESIPLCVNGRLGRTLADGKSAIYCCCRWHFTHFRINRRTELRSLTIQYLSRTDLRVLYSPPCNAVACACWIVNSAIGDFCGIVIGCFLFPSNAEFASRPRIRITPSVSMNGHNDVSVLDLSNTSNALRSTHSYSCVSFLWAVFLLWAPSMVLFSCLFSIAGNARIYLWSFSTVDFYLTSTAAYHSLLMRYVTLLKCLLLSWCFWGWFLLAKLSQLCW